MAGGGIAGLTAALCLARRGFRVEVFERSISADTSGAGLQISPNALSILEDLGLGRQLRRLAVSPQAIRMLAAGNAGHIKTIPLGAEAIASFGLPYLVMHRADLHQALFGACQGEPDITIHEGCSVTDMTSHANGASALVSSQNGVTTRRGLALVAADGVHSAIRTGTLGLPPARHSGFEAWRAMIPADKVPARFGMEHTQLVMAGNSHAVLYPVRNGRYLNVVICRKTRNRGTDVRRNAPYEELKRGLFFWSRHFRELFAQAGPWSVWPILEMPRSRQPHHDHGVVLIGDAAHAMTPFAAQGAAMAIEDAAVLAELMGRSENPASVGPEFEALRARRWKRVADLAQANGRIYHMRWPLSTFRNIGMAFIPAKRLLMRQAWLYGWRPQA